MLLHWPIHWYHSRADLIWPDGPFKRKMTCCLFLPAIFLFPVGSLPLKADLANSTVAKKALVT